MEEEPDLACDGYAQRHRLAFRVRLKPRQGRPHGDAGLVEAAIPAIVDAAELCDSDVKVSQRVRSSGKDAALPSVQVAELATVELVDEGEDVDEEVD